MQKWIQSPDIQYLKQSAIQNMADWLNISLINHWSFASWSKNAVELIDCLKKGLEKESQSQ